MLKAKSGVVLLWFDVVHVFCSLCCAHDLGCVISCEWVEMATWSLWRQLFALMLSSLHLRLPKLLKMGAWWGERGEVVGDTIARKLKVFLTNGEASRLCLRTCTTPKYLVLVTSLFLSFFFLLFYQGRWYIINRMPK